MANLTGIGVFIVTLFIMESRGNLCYLGDDFFESFRLTQLIPISVSRG
ncbi:hypothetical protein CWATWH0402_2774 [Crocosphaera watsonii WH 0402]|uniref:Uncharacterized protein n=1 Tax=Crocosphaera watsonii WH 0402 TaxID=1284629 RepID=T2JJ38_CROWT|nr:hypothetical protein CWATWH0402_2774 [Crocosphaera watsonii WH 0402]